MSQASGQHPVNWWVPTPVNQLAIELSRDHSLRPEPGMPINHDNRHKWTPGLEPGAEGDWYDRGTITYCRYLPNIPSTLSPLLPDSFDRHYENNPDNRDCRVVVVLGISLQTELLRTKEPILKLE